MWAQKKITTTNGPSTIRGYSSGSGSSSTLDFEKEMSPSAVAFTNKMKNNLTESKVTKRKWSSAEWDALLAANVVERWEVSTSKKFYSFVSTDIYKRFGLHNSGKLNGFYREWAAGFITCQADEGVFIFSHEFEYACLVSVDIHKAMGYLKNAADKCMEGCWRRMGEVYDKGKPGQYPGQEEEEEEEDEEDEDEDEGTDGGDEAYEYESEYRYN